MPFKSKAQQRFMFAEEERGGLPKGTAEQWAKETPNIKALPEKVKKDKGIMKKHAAILHGFLYSITKEAAIPLLSALPYGYAMLASALALRRSNIINRANKAGLTPRAVEKLPYTSPLSELVQKRLPQAGMIGGAALLSAPILASLYNQSDNT